LLLSDKQTKLAVMKTLLILRHAKAKDEADSDKARPLKKSGRRAATFMGTLLVQEKLMPDVIISSTAVRAKETTELVIEAAAYAGPLHYLDELYLAPPSTYMKALERLAGQAERAMLVGHNPSLEELVTRLTGEIAPLATAALAECALPIATWQDLSTATNGKLRMIWRAKEFLED
jgi:phosphohistidine phosphatase